MIDIALLPERLRTKILIPEDPNDCWEWLACVSPVGYGRFGWEGKAHEVHRVVYTLLVGPIPAGLVIDHICHTEACRKVNRECLHRRCQNPLHLSPVTRKANVMRAINPITINARKTECAKGHPYTPETQIIDGGYRRCILCRREFDRKRRPRKNPNPRLGRHRLLP